LMAVVVQEPPLGLMVTVVCVARVDGRVVCAARVDGVVCVARVVCRVDGGGWCRSPLCSGRSVVTPGALRRLSTPSTRTCCTSGANPTYHLDAWKLPVGQIQMLPLE
jgi:hypothetical protein